MTFLIYVCVAALLVLLWLLRIGGLSLGLPLVYLFALLLIHVPGAYAHVVSDGLLLNSDLIATAMRSAAIGAVCFVVGVGIARSSVPTVSIRQELDHRKFWLFCLGAGWVLTYGMAPLYRIPSVAAAANQGGAIWMLGVLLGLRAAVSGGDFKWITIWLGALAVYPALMLLMGGFLSYGSTATMIVLSGVAVSTLSYWRAVAGILVITVLGLGFFVTYFQHRDDIRTQVWGGAPLADRMASVRDMASDFQLFDPANQDHLIALDQRLNQNYFVGIAAERLDQNEVDYLYGRSVWEGILALVPRIVWPEKPVFGGSPKIVAEMTGLELNSEDTSFGVGNVMEFYINFGTAGIVVGFLLLGWALGTLDMKAAVAAAQGDFSTTILCFLPAVALIQPNGSLVELFGGTAAAVVAAYGWRSLWRQVEALGWYEHLKV